MKMHGSPPCAVCTSFCRPSWQPVGTNCDRCNKGACPDCLLEYDTQSLCALCVRDLPPLAKCAHCDLHPFERNASLLAICCEECRRPACGGCLHVYAAEEGAMLVCLNCQETLQAGWEQEQEALLKRFARITGDCTSEGRRLLSRHEWSLELALLEYVERT